MRRIQICTILLSGAVAVGPTPTLSAQAVRPPSAQTSRAEIETAAAQAESILVSPGYSGRIKSAKRRELAILRNRLQEGDLGPGDQVVLFVDGEKDLSGSFVVSPARILTLPGIGDIPLQGVLRSEIETHLTTELRKYLRNPAVHAQTTMRLSVLGAVGRPGYYQVSSALMLADAIMASGGPSGGIDPATTRVERKGVELFSKESIALALQEGKTLDQLGLRAGDEILVGGERAAKTPTGFTNVVLPLLTGALSLTYIMVQILP